MRYHLICSNNTDEAPEVNLIVDEPEDPREYLHTCLVSDDWFEFGTAFVRVSDFKVVILQEVSND